MKSNTDFSKIISVYDTGKAGVSNLNYKFKKC